MRRDDFCVFCDSPLKELHRMPDFPIWMGACKEIFHQGGHKPASADLIYTACQSCHQLQINKLVPLKDLYAANHNTDIVGPTWEAHYKELSRFICDHMPPYGDEVLEIGDPSAKLANMLSHEFKKWTIVEPNPGADVFNSNVKFVKEFFTAQTDVAPADFIVHSHCLEHAYDPIRFLLDCRNKLKDEGTMVFSIPAMDKIMEYHPWPVLTMNFEHTLYMDVHTIQYMLGQAGFELTGMKRFGNHSIFFSARKSDGYDFNLGVVNFFKALAFQKALDTCDDEVKKICKHQPYWPSRLYVFGCHVTSQYILRRIAKRMDGWPEGLVEGVLDNSYSKEGMYLNGTSLKTLKPKEILQHEKVAVITSHSGAYREEIEKQLKGIAHGVQLL